MLKQKYTPRSLEERIRYSKRFSSAERKSYYAGKRMGFLEGIHKKLDLCHFRTNSSHNEYYSSPIYDDLDKIDLKRK